MTGRYRINIYRKLDIFVELTRAPIAGRVDRGLLILKGYSELA
jgi:hypothetical protein